MYSDAQRILEGFAVILSESYDLRTHAVIVLPRALQQNVNVSELKGQIEGSDRQI